MFKRVTLVLGALVLAFAVAGIGQAAESTIPPGTVITQQNWQKYSQFMTANLKWMFMHPGNVDGWPPGAEAKVGPMTHWAVPPTFLNATEKYSKQVKLVKVPGGSYTLKGYVAGMPFPNLSTKDPLAGYKLMYDLYFSNVRAFSGANRIQVLDIDRYGNLSFLHALIWTFQWDHITDPGYPEHVPGLSGAFLSGGAEQLDPEQIKYVTALNITWDDPNRFPESYVFLPALRRSLRLSSAARCAPFQGQDFANDDETPVPLPPTWFKAEFKGLKPSLEFIFKPGAKTRAEAVQWTNWYHRGTGNGNFIPKADVFGASWQLRPVYVVALQRLPQHASGYCYANKEEYLDQETDESLSWADWDENNKPYRTIFPFSIPLKMPKGGGWDLFTAGWAHDGCDYQNNHCSLLIPAKQVYINQEAPAQFQDRTLYATPAGLDQIMR